MVARKFVRSLNLNGEADWRLYCKGEIPDLLPKPEDIPTAVARVYKNKGWISWPDWLGKTKASTCKYYLQILVVSSVVAFPFRVYI